MYYVYNLLFASAYTFVFGYCWFHSLSEGQRSLLKTQLFGDSSIFRKYTNNFYEQCAEPATLRESLNNVAVDPSIQLIPKTGAPVTREMLDYMYPSPGLSSTYVPQFYYKEFPESLTPPFSSPVIPIETPVSEPVSERLPMTYKELRYLYFGQRTPKDFEELFPESGEFPDFPEFPVS